MDAVFFSVKQAHLAGRRFCRQLLAPLDLTPARFDALVAIGGWGTTQRELRRRLGLARSTVSELVDSLVVHGLVRRWRATDRRTWDLRCTTRGCDLLERAYALINDGFVPLTLDRDLAAGAPEIDVQHSRFVLMEALSTIACGFGRPEPPDLYLWHPEDFLGALTWPGDEAPEVPFAA